MIQKILVANRGEIALRVMKTARQMGIKTVAVYSEADRKAPHTRYADESYFLGPAPSRDSYLHIDKIIEAAKKTGADAVHPGYGFLSEQADFATALKENNITFIGPSEEAITTMGDKLSAKRAVEHYEVPMVPGHPSAVEDVKEGKEIARKIGYPVLIKASAGGGGKGMRIVQNESDFEEQMERAISEATSAFGDGTVFIEKYIGSPRHIEIQVLADNYGNIIHLCERECSIQRRHQKVVEEAPSPVVDADLRKKMGEAAINVARSCNYTGAGTVEFLMDEDKNFYFLEMNTRLQVEHPVTELICGLDLVEQQIRVARGEKLGISQEDIKINGSAIELRVYAEDPRNNFLPSIGRLHQYDEPQLPYCRVDSGYEEGMDIPIHYDPMISKLIVHGGDRNESIQRMTAAIDQYKIEGVANTLEFGSFVMAHPAFQSGDFDTHFVKNHFDAASLNGKTNKMEEIASAFSTWLYLKNKENLKLPVNNNSEWEKRKITDS